MSAFQIFNTAQIESLRRGGKILRGCLDYCSEIVKPGMTTKELDALAETFIRDHDGALPGFKGYKGFAGTLCTSVNEQCVHGLPSDYTLQDGDIISIDCGVLYDNLYTDACNTVALGQVSKEVHNLMNVSKQALYDGLEQVRPGAHIGDISSTIQHTVEKGGCSVIKMLTGHGLGDTLHQFPDVPNFGTAGTGPVLPPWTLFCIEPIVCTGRNEITQASDGWTLSTKDNSPCAHYEHTVLTTEYGYEVIA